MDKFLKSLSIIADALTIISLIWAIAWSFYHRKRSLIGLKINVFVVSLLRFVFICIVGAIFYRFWEFIYGFVSIIFNGGSAYQRYYWDDNNIIPYLFSFFTSGLIILILFWLTITIIWTSSFENVIDFINILIPKNVRIKKVAKNKLVIINAQYGINDKYIDVTDKLNQMIIDNKLSILASNELAGDPIIGVPKELRIKYRFNDYEQKEEIAKENETITIEINK